MKMLKRSLAWMLALIMLISAVPFTAFASESTDVPSEATEAVVDAPAGETTPSEAAEAETVPETTVAETTVPETTVAEETVPETTVAEETVPETTVAEETVPETTVAEETVPETTVAEETVPEETVADEPVEEVPAVMSLTEATTQSDAFTHKIVHLDNGRKYYTAEWIKALITEMAADGFTQLQLAFGNDGLRFLLDDMSVTVNGTTYSSENVTAGIQAGNKAYYDDGVNELTQAEMDEIIAHAKAKGIEIVPHMNMPGHMDAIVDAIEYVGISDAHFTGYTTSARSLNLNNDTAVAFTKALLEKYVAYFDAKGCNYFHIGADEFANDAYNGNMGFPSMGSTLYTKFATFVNDCAAIVTKAGMTPRAWNDGISYTDYSDSFDTDIEITYWSSGWSGYNVAAASTLRSNGHSMINTHGSYYYILGVNDCYTSGTSTSHVGYDYTAAEGFTNSTFMGSTVSDPVGSMFCIWGDVPGAETETEVAKYIRPILRVMAARMDGSSSYDVDTIVEGGFNADGTINVVETEEPTPEVPETVTKTDEATKVAVTAPGLTELTVTAVEEAKLPVIEAAVAGKVVAWDMTPATDAGAHVGEAVVSVPVSADWTNVRGGVLASDNGEEVMGIKGTLENGVFTFTVPHFSTVVVYAEDPNAVDSVIPGDGTATSYVLDTDGLDVDAQYLIVYDGKALTNAAGSLAVSVSGNNATPSGDTSVALWKYTRWTNQNGNYRYGLTNGSNYLYPSRSGSSSNRTYDLNIGDNATRLSIENNGDGTYKIANNDENSYVAYTSEGWGAQGSSQDLYFYKYTEGTQTYTVNAAKQENRINTNTVTNDGYTDESWAAYEAALATAQAKLTEVESATYNSEAAANTALTELIATVDALEAAKNALAKAVQITINYVDADGKIVKTETKNVAENATSVTLTSPIFDAADNRYNLGSTTLELTLSTTTTYSVNVTLDDDYLTNVDPLTVEYWITNARLNGSTSGNNNISIEVDDSGIHTEAGVAIATLVDASASTGGRTQTYWQSKILDVELDNSSTSGTEHQTLLSGDDETLNGATFTHVRYWNGAWQVKTASGWVSVDRTQVQVTDYDSEGTNGTITRDKNQLVAYYMEVVDIQNANGTTELTVNTADWGKKGDGTAASDYLDPNSTVSVSIQIIYEDGTGNPANVADTVYPTVEDLRSKTIVYGYWPDGRGLGTMVFTGGEQFEIYKVTAETGAHTVSGSTWEGVTVNSFTWDNNAKTVWEDDPSSSVSIGNPASSPSSEDPYDNLMWDENHEAILIRVYVKAVETDDSLTVVYYDEKFGDTLYSYNITVDPNKNFNDNMVGTPAELSDGRINVTGCGIENVYGVTQYFQTDLTQVPEAVGKYRNDLYTYTGSEISKDGKTLYLYYNIDTTVLSPNYVIDFGLPLTFELEALLGEGTEVEHVDSVNDLSARYGTLTYSNGTFTYTPTTILMNIDVLSINLTIDGESATTNVGVTPATTVYYGEKFVDFSTGWTTSGNATNVGNQETEVLGELQSDNVPNVVYGYDDAYNAIGASDGTAKKSVTIGDTATFQFTGNGIQIFANTTPSSGHVSVKVENSEEQTVKLAIVDTVVNGTEGTDTTGEQAGDLAGLPIVSLLDMKDVNYDTYTVTITKVLDTEPVYIDGIRIFNTIDETARAEDEESIYLADLEDNPDFYEMRDVVLKAINIDTSISEDYKTMYQQVYDSTVAVGSSAVITSAGADYVENTRQDLLDNGPKNELYLFPGDTLTFSVSTNRVMQLGMKAPNAAVTANITVNGVKTTQTISSSVDMFYRLAEKGGSAYTVSIENPVGSEGILSVTLLKICDDPNAAFVPLTEKDVANILAAAGYTDDEAVEPETTVPETTKPADKPTKPSKPQETTKPQTPTEPEAPSKPETPSVPQTPGKPQTPSVPEADKADAVLTVSLVDYAGRKLGSAVLSANGPEGETKVFTAAEILATAKAMLPQQYAFVDEAKIADAAVAYGEEHIVSIQVGKVATLKINYISLFGRKLGSATITKVQTAGGRCLISASEIRAQAPNGRFALWLLPVSVNYGATASVAAVLF